MYLKSSFPPSMTIQIYYLNTRVHAHNLTLPAANILAAISNSQFPNFRKEEERGGGSKKSKQYRLSEKNLCSNFLSCQYDMRIQFDRISPLPELLLVLSLKFHA